MYNGGAFDRCEEKLCLHFANEFCACCKNLQPNPNSVWMENQRSFDSFPSVFSFVCFPSSPNSLWSIIVAIYSMHFRRVHMQFRLSMGLQVLVLTLIRDHLAFNFASVWSVKVQRIIERHGQLHKQRQPEKYALQV